MKFLIHAATSLATLLVAALAVYFLQQNEVVFVLSHAQAENITGVFSQQQEMLHTLWNALQSCKAGS